MTEQEKKIDQYMQTLRNEIQKHASNYSTTPQAVYERLKPTFLTILKALVK